MTAKKEKEASPGAQVFSGSSAGTLIAGVKANLKSLLDIFLQNWSYT